MSVVIRSPATIIDMAELAGAVTRNMWAVALEQLSAGETWSVWVDGDLVALAGLYPIDDRAAEAWFNLTPAAAPAMLAIMRVIRLTLESGRYREIVAVVRSPAGQRIARFSGLVRHSTHEYGELWTWNCSVAEARPKGRRKATSAAR